MRWIALALLAALAGCGPSAQDQAAADAEAVAEVKAHQDAPAEAISLDPITYADVERANLFGAGCNILPPDGDGTAIAHIIAQADAAHFKQGGELIRMAADAGSPELPYLARAKYGGLAYSMTLEIDEETGRRTGMETIDYPASVSIRDAKGRVVFEDRGTAQCGA